jgi:hypothetical protein
MRYLVATCAASLFMVLASPVFADQIAVVGTTDQQASLDASPALKADLQKAAASGLLSDIRIVPRDEVRAGGPFEAAVRGREIILTPEWAAVRIEIENGHLTNPFAIKAELVSGSSFWRLNRFSIIRRAPYPIVDQF